MFQRGYSLFSCFSDGFEQTQRDSSLGYFSLGTVAKSTVACGPGCSEFRFEENCSTDGNLVCFSNSDKHKGACEGHVDNW